MNKRIAKRDPRLSRIVEALKSLSGGTKVTFILEKCGQISDARWFQGFCYKRAGKSWVFIGTFAVPAYIIEREMNALPYNKANQWPG